MFASNFYSNSQSYMEAILTNWNFSQKANWMTTNMTTAYPSLLDVKPKNWSEAAKKFEEGQDVACLRIQFDGFDSEGGGSYGLHEALSLPEIIFRTLDKGEDLAYLLCRGIYSHALFCVQNNNEAEIWDELFEIRRTFSSRESFSRLYRENELTDKLRHPILKALSAATSFLNESGSKFVNEAELNEWAKRSIADDKAKKREFDNRSAEEKERIADEVMSSILGNLDDMNTDEYRKKEKERKAAYATFVENSFKNESMAGRKSKPI